MAKKKPRLGDIVEIYWEDATSDTSDFSLDDIRARRPYYCRRKVVGYFLMDYDDYIILCADITVEHPAEADEDRNDYASLSSIPKNMVTSLRVVESSRPDKQIRKGRT